MVRDYRAWLQSELQRLERPRSETALAGEAGMARRALERLDAETGDRVLLELEPDQAEAIASELEVLAQAESLPDSLLSLLQLLRAQR